MADSVDPLGNRATEHMQQLNDVQSQMVDAQDPVEMLRLSFEAQREANMVQLYTEAQTKKNKVEKESISTAVALRS